VPESTEFGALNRAIVVIPAKYWETRRTMPQPEGIGEREDTNT
jgi:hypothetical protein